MTPPIIPGNPEREKTEKHSHEVESKETPKENEKSHSTKTTLGSLSASTGHLILNLSNWQIFRSS